jgi:hypothetical protein
MKKDYSSKELGEVLFDMSRAGFACVLVQTVEEERVEKIVNKAVVFDNVFTVSFQHLAVNKKTGDVVRIDNLSELSSATKFKDKSVFVVFDARIFFNDPLSVRQLKTIFDTLRRDAKMVIFVGPTALPPELSEVTTLVLQSPSREELEKVLDFVVGAQESASGSSPGSSLGWFSSKGLLGVAIEHKMTIDEAEDYFSLELIRQYRKQKS